LEIFGGMSMPTISEFFGIIIRMYYDEHNPPHFHAYYAEHRQALLDDWHLAATHQALNRINPLE
jgi:hypothetical protein